MRKLTDDELSRLLTHNTGDLKKIEVIDGFDLSKCEIINNNFRGKNVLGCELFLLNSIIADTTVDSNVSVVTSTVVKSVIGQCTIIKNGSVVKDTVTSPIVLPVLQDNNKTESRLFYVLINNSQVEGDVILGGTDMRKTLSRGGSVFAFAHIGGGEFTKNIVFGTQPDAESSKKLVCIPHFGYYGKMIVASLAVYNDGKLPDIDSDSFNDAYLEAYSHRYFNTELPNETTYETGRVNLGSGGSFSDYDPVKDTKAGAILLLADTGVNVTIPPFLTMLYHSLIANGSIDVNKVTDNIIPPGSLVSGARDNGFMLEGYYTDNEPKIMNDRCHAEMKFVIRYLKLILTFAKFSERGSKFCSGIQKYAWNCAINTLVSTAKSVNGRWLNAYFNALEKNSIPGLKKRLENQNESRLQKKLDTQLDLLSKKAQFVKLGELVMEEIRKLQSEKMSIDEIFEKTGQKVRINHTTEHNHQLKTTIISVPDEVTV